MPDNGAPDWPERSAFGTSRGVTWWSALLIAVLPTAAGSLLDTLIWGQPGLLFMSAFFVGCLVAIGLVRRGSLFGPMVQPPLVLVVSMPLIVLIVGGGKTSGGGSTAKILSIATPLINAFPIMAVTTALAMGVGLFRMYRLQPADQELEPGEPDPDAKTKKAKPVRKPAERQRGPEGSGKRPEREQRQDGKPRSGSARGQMAPPERGKPSGEAGRSRGQGSPRPRKGEAPRGSVPPGQGSGPRPAPGRGSGPRPAPGRGRPKPDQRRRPRNDDDLF